MSKADRTKPPGNHAEHAGPAGKKRGTEAAFDLWLQRGLHEIYDTIAREPIPDELLRLIEEDRKK